MRVGRWAILIGLSCIFAGLFEWVGFPAARLLGPMFAGIAVALTGEAPKVPRYPFRIAQALVGCLIARSMPLSVFTEIGDKWPIFIAGVTFVVVAAGILGWLQMRFGSLPGTTALWGASPGGAAAITLMAEAYGADVRLVALMQYLRVAGVALTASLIAHFWSAGVAIHPAAIVWFPEVSAISLLETLMIAFGGVWLAMRLRVSAGAMLVPMVLGIILSNTGLVAITLPPWLLTIAYAIIGWNIGLRFTRAIIVQSARAFPAILLSTSTLILACGLFAILLARIANIDLMTAYLATSPGGADSIAIIAAASHVDLPFVMSMQTCRLIVVMLVGPVCTRFLADRLARPPLPTPLSD
jgi:membrane AbrB-like protein